MNIELVVNGATVAEFDGSVEGTLRFQAATFHHMAEAQGEYRTALDESSRIAFSKLNEMQFGKPKTVSTDPHSKGQEA